MLYNSYTMCTRGSPDIHPQPSGLWRGPWASGVYIRQTTRAHGITIKCGSLLRCMVDYKAQRYMIVYKVTYSSL